MNGLYTSPLSVVCPTCKSAPGANCTEHLMTGGGWQTKDIIQFHDARIKAVEVTHGS